MENKSWTYLDRSKWPHGEWDDEPDKMQWLDDATGLPCLIVRNAQECCEVAICCTKAQHFGLAKIEPEQPLTNAERLNDEVHDVLAMIELLQMAGIVTRLSERDKQARISAKLRKADTFRDYSRELGRLS